MTTETENLVLELLRAIRGDIASLRTDVGELKERVTRVDLGLASLRREAAIMGEAIAHIQAHQDRFQDRIERLERRFDVSTALPPVPHQ